MLRSAAARRASSVLPPVGFAAAANGRAQIFADEHVARRSRNTATPMHFLLQFAHIARPVVALQTFQGTLGNTAYANFVVP